ncbi:MAG: cob(I)yrinic acid a,c-diamide adenosyltransferase [Candidatus Puniceispirillales bacterium]
MVKLNKIYTRTGDKGETSLVNGHRVSKHSIRPTAFGTVDEVNSIIGICRLHTAKIEDNNFDNMLSRIQNDLFDLGADLATPIGEERPDDVLRVTDKQVNRLETEIDTMNSTLQPLNSFVLPGGQEAAAYIHLARAMTRRAERDMTRLSVEEPVGQAAMQYINRLSDHLFVMARSINQQHDGDVLWKPAANA